MDVIAISGHARAGKDTLAKELKKELEKKGKRVLITHYADFLKYICSTYYGWDGQKDEKGRQLLQTVGQSFRDNHYNCWVNMMSNFLSGVGKSIDIVIIADCRYKNELDIDFRGMENIYSIRIIRPDFDNGLTPEQQAHPSETDLDNYEFDLYVKNDSTEERFLSKVPIIIQDFNLKTGKLINII